MTEMTLIQRKREGNGVYQKVAERQKWKIQILITREREQSECSVIFVRPLHCSINWHSSVYCFLMIQTDGQRDKGWLNESEWRMKRFTENINSSPSTQCRRLQNECIGFDESSDDSTERRNDRGLTLFEVNFRNTQGSLPLRFQGVTGYIDECEAPSHCYSP